MSTPTNAVGNEITDWMPSRSEHPPAQARPVGRPNETTICDLCGVPKAVDPCTHVIIANGQVTMSVSSWERLCQQLHDARNRLEAVHDHDEWDVLYPRSGT